MSLSTSSTTLLSTSSSSSITLFPSTTLLTSIKMFRCCTNGPFTTEKWNRVRLIIGVIVAVLCVLVVGLLVHHFTKQKLPEKQDKTVDQRVCFTCASCNGSIDCSLLGLPIDSACRNSPKYMTRCEKDESCYKVDAAGRNYQYFIRKCATCAEEKKEGCRTTMYKGVNSTFCFCNTDRMNLITVLTSIYLALLLSQGNWAEDPIHVQIEKHHCNITPSSGSQDNFITETWHEAVDGIKTLLAPVIEEGKEIGNYVSEVEENWMEKLNKFFQAFQWIFWIVAFVIIVKILVFILCCECKRKKSWGKIKMEVRNKIADGGV